MISKIILCLFAIPAILIPKLISEESPKQEIGYESLYEEIVNQGIEYPEIVWAQAVLESGNFKSDVFRGNNNLFGMKLPSRRSTVACGSKNGYATYNDWQESIRDYKLYQEYYFKDRKISKASYYSHLNRVYCEIGSQYSERVKEIISKMYDPKFQTPDYLKDGVFGNYGETDLIYKNEK